MEEDIQNTNGAFATYRERNIANTTSSEDANGT